MLLDKEIVELVQDCTYKPDWFVDVRWDADRPYIQLTVYNSMDSQTRVKTTWKSGKRYLSPHMCRQEIVGAVFGLIKDAEEHETREWFRYKGASIFNPHLDPNKLADLARQASSFCVRDNAMSMKENS